MKKTLFAGTVAAVSIAAGVAVAADLPRGPAPYYNPAPASVYNWAGVYAGLNLGYGWGKVTNTGANPSGILGGGQLGVNWQSGQFVYGAETDLQGTGADDTFAGYKFSNPWFGTVRGRAGYAINNILLYGTLGLAYGDLRGDFGGAVETHTMAGWTGGVGAEVGLAPAWSVKGEYLYMDLADRGFGITGMDNGYRSNMFRFGFNYHF
jgi:outer membrane immunogenic protein